MSYKIEIEPRSETDIFFAALYDMRSGEEVEISYAEGTYPDIISDLLEGFRP